MLEGSDEVLLAEKPDGNLEEGRGWYEAEIPLTEGLSSNFGVIKGDVLYTAPEGTVRAMMI